MKALPLVKGGAIVGEKSIAVLHTHTHTHTHTHIYIICSKAKNLKGYKQDQTENTGHLGEGAKGIKSLF